MTATLTLILGLTGIFLAIASGVLASVALMAERHRVTRSLAAIRGLEIGTGRHPELNRPFADRVLLPGLARLTRIGRRFTPGDHTARIRQRLELAGNPQSWDVDRVIAFRTLGVFVGFVLGLALPFVLGLGPLPIVGFAIAATVTGYFVPAMALYQLAYNRREQMQRELPDALDLLTISVEAGLAFDAALAQVARNTTGPLAQELSRVLQEMQIGLGRSDAMRALGERTDLPELKTFITAMVQAEGLGIPIAQVLRVQAREMRIKRSQRAEELAQKVPVKILFPLIFCILPALFVVVLGPAAIQILDNFRGRI